MEAISEHMLSRKIDYTYLTLQVFEQARKGDEVSTEILKQVGENCARSAGGVIVNLKFDEEVDVILAGSVWVKGASEVMINNFKTKIEEYTKKKCNIIILGVPPATGAVIWALELAKSEYPNEKTRQTIIENVEKQLNKIEGRA